MSRIFTILATLFVTLFIISCGSDDSSSDTGLSTSTKTGVITHSGGFDFSADTNATWEHQDVYNMGSVIILADNNVEKIYSLGELSLDSITSADDSKWTEDTSLTVEINSVYVLKARDGYVKFKVISIDTSTFTGDMTVEYVYSTTTTF